MYIIMSFYLFILNIIYWVMSIFFLTMNFTLLIEWNILNINTMKLMYILFIDWMSLMFLSTIMLITSMVLIYSMGYMSNDIFMPRFMMLITIFMLSMKLMIISPNFISILLGWDGLGLSSYCLVAYYSNKKSFNSSMITILMNRVGDIMILISISLMINYGSWNMLFFKKFNLMFLLLILIAATTKSAQIPFSMWLPLAMAAPTPVSSLVHSSTLVTAGVYLLIRFHYLMNNKFLYFLIMLSLITMTMASSSAMFENDFKKIIALSTLSQMSIMIMTISMNLTYLTFFHLITHAMFKSLLFLCSGIIIHNSNSMQDIRHISFMNKSIPYINMVFLLASLSLCGLPFLSGFYSKDTIIDMFLVKKFSWLMTFMMYLSMMNTVIYSTRTMFFITIKPLKMNIMPSLNFNNIMNYSIILLTMLTIFYGSMLNWLILSSLNLVILPPLMKMFILYTMLFSFMFTLLIMNNKMIFNYLNSFFNQMWFYSNIFKFNKNKLISYSYPINFLMENMWWIYPINLLTYNFNLMLKFNFFNLNFFSMLLMMTYIFIMSIII